MSAVKQGLGIVQLHDPGFAKKTNFTKIKNKMFFSTFPKYLLPLTFSPNGWILYQLVFMYYVENHKEILVSKPKKKN